MSAQPEPVAFRLDSSEFERWWKTAVDPEDRASYIHLHQGHMEGARFVCALDHLTRNLGQQRTDDVIVRAYLIASGLPESDLRVHKIRYEAQAMYEDDAVSTLIESVRYRSGKAAEERIGTLAVNKIEALFERSNTLSGEEQLDTEKVALDGSIRFLGIRERAASAAQARRDKKAVQRAMQINASRGTEAAKLPTLEEAGEFMKMLVNEFGAEAAKQLVDKAMKPALASGESDVS